MTSWILDYGAYRHMTGRAYFLFNVVNIFPVSITLPNGSTPSANCEGNTFLCSIYLLTRIIYKFFNTFFLHLFL